MTEKRKPAYDLKSFRAAFSTIKGLNVTGTALRSAAELGYGRDEIINIIQTMTPSHFYKSMTSNYDQKIWQDVYHVPHDDLLLYVKFAADAVTEFKLLSLKEK